MSFLFTVLLGAALTTNPPGASNRLDKAGESSITTPDPKDPVEKEFQKVMSDDDEAMAEVDRWIRENNEFAAKGAGVPPEQLKRRIEVRLEPVQKSYEDFLKRHPNHARGHVAYAAFLHDINEEDDAEREHLEKALTIETNDPAIYNNLANLYGHRSPVKKAFEYYAKAIQLNPREPVYYHNFGTTVFLFRTDAKEYYGITEEQVFAKALELYSNSMRLDPENFELAQDVAQTYYGIRPMRTDEALKAWTNTLKTASNEIEREGVYIHFARIKGLAHRFAEARTHLDAVTNDYYADLKGRVSKMVERTEKEMNNTNAVAPLKPPPTAKKPEE
jgi:tetratricopeptide (TPR) repeat protein